MIKRVIVVVLFLAVVLIGCGSKEAAPPPPTVPPPTLSEFKEGAERYVTDQLRNNEATQNKYVTKSDVCQRNDDPSADYIALVSISDGFFWGLRHRKGGDADEWYDDPKFVEIMSAPTPPTATDPYLDTPGRSAPSNGDEVPETPVPPPSPP